MGGAVIMGILIFIIYYRKKKEESLEREHQMQLYAYTTEINNLEAKKENAISQIWELKKSKEEYGQKISELQEEAKNSEAAIHKLNKDIQSLLNERAPKLKQGSLLYNHIMDGGTTSGWHYNETTAFNSYYAATHYRSYSRIMKVERSTKLSAHNLFYLILKDMGKTDDGKFAASCTFHRKGCALSEAGQNLKKRNRRHFTESSGGLLSYHDSCQDHWQ